MSNRSQGGTQGRTERSSEPGQAGPAPAPDPHAPDAQGPDAQGTAPAAPDPGHALAAEWAAALAAGGASVSAADVTGTLHGLAVRTLAIAWGVPFQPRRASDIGAALVDAKFLDAGVLGCTLTVIGRHIAAAAPGPGAPGPGAPDRVSAIQEAVATGYVQALVEYQRRRDPLTGLASHALFLDRLAAATSGPGERIGLCSLDLDGFKAINDTLGYDIGDELLVAVARRLERRVAGLDATVARVGGDEFLLLVADSGGIDAMVALAAGLRAAIEQPFRLGAHRLCLTASIGVADRAAAGTRPSELVKEAEIALHWARADGPGHSASYDPARQADDNARITLTASMRTALEAGEFSVVYQPIVDLPGGELRGVEALLRWNHPALGKLSPETFIALAEESGVITPLGRWVIGTACHQAAQWQRIRPGTAPFISVNLSPQQAQDPGFVGDVARILAETELPPETLQLELTESALVEADSRPLETLQKLSAMGVRIAADDFGSGYSNLAYLRRLPVDALKLSASFVREVWPDGPADEPIISALAGLAHTLGLNVTVEGVETREQADRLAALGCDTAQGWYFASALPGSDITATLRDVPRPRYPRA